MSNNNNKSTGKTVTFDPLTRTSSGSVYPSKEITDHHKANPRERNHHRLDPKGKRMTFFGPSRTTWRDPTYTKESNAALWQTPNERELAKVRNAFAHQRASIIKKLEGRRHEIINEIKDLKKILQQMEKEKIKDPIFKKDIDNLEDNLKTEIITKEKEISIADINIAYVEEQMGYIMSQDDIIKHLPEIIKNIKNIKKQMGYIMSQDDIIIEERHINHSNDNKWIKSVIEKLPHLDEPYIKMRYEELISGGIMGGVKKKSKKRMVQRKSKTRKVIKTKLKKTNKKYR